METTDPGCECIRALPDPRLSAPDSDAHDVCQHLSQATLLPDVTRLLVETEDGPAWIPTPTGAVVLSQTCDVAQANRHTVQVSPLAQLDGNLAKEAARENRPRYAPVWTAESTTADDPLGYADLEVVATWSKKRLAHERQQPASWHTSTETRRFGRAVGRRFSRFAWPDRMQPWLRPLEEILQHRYNEATQPAGRLVADLQQVRVGADQWEHPQAQLTLHFIFEPGVLPPSDVPEPPSAAVSQFLDTDPTWKRIAEELERTSAPQDRSALYQAAADRWAGACTPKGTQADDVLQAVVDVDAQIWSADEFSVDMARQCPNLDVDYVSEPTAGD